MDRSLQPQTNPSYLYMAVLSIAAGLMTLLLLLFFSGILPASTEVLPVTALTIATILGLCIVSLHPRSLFIAFLIACIVIPWALERFSIPLGFMKLYTQDVVFALNFLLILWLFSIRRITYPRIPFNRFILMHFTLGIFALAVGFTVSRNQFDDVFGDFRRSFFYFMNYFVAILLLNSLGGLRLLRTALIAGGTGAIARGIYELITGKFTYRRIGDAAHILSHFEIIFLMFAAYYALGQILFNPSTRKWLWGALLGSAILVILIGNFRACWISFFGGLLFIFLYLPRRQKGMLVGLGIGMIAFVALLVASLWDVQIVEGRSTLGQELAQKADVTQTRGDVNVVWRFESYANALAQWQESPITGTGLGEVLEFIATTSTGGAMMTEGHRVHNSFIWLLMSLGVIGFSVFLYIQWQYVVTLLRYLRTTTWLEGRLTIMACGAFYAAFMTATNFEIFFESAMPITVLSSSMALAMLIIHHTPPAQVPSRQD